MTGNAAWEDWLEYFLNAVARISEDSARRAERINSTLEEFRRAIAGISSRTPSALVDLLAENPFWTIKGVAERLEVAYTTAERAVERLVSAGILRQVNEARRDRVFCARRLMDILEEPARLTLRTGTPSTPALE